jgi:MinD superfamily P-loop ATPase
MWPGCPAPSCQATGIEGHMTELVVVSGKGGTGKTSITACLAALASGEARGEAHDGSRGDGARSLVLADCDVDAADLHLVTDPRIRERHGFIAGRQAAIRQEDCIGCGACLAHCRFEAVQFAGRQAGDAQFAIDPVACEGCGVCVRFCPVGAIGFPERCGGEWYESETRFGPMVHARLAAGAESSGKLVSIVRDAARRIAEEQGIDRILVDGPPGIGCPVIASVTGATLVLIVAEPTVSSRHDLHRILDLTRHFGLPAVVWLNKWDLNPDLAGRIEAEAADRRARTVGRSRYDPAVTVAQVAGRAVVEDGGGPVGEEIREGWSELCTATKW